MSNDRIAIFGCGGFGREVAMLIEQINDHSPQWHIVGFFDDKNPGISSINGYPYLGDMQQLNKYDGKLAIVIAIGSPQSKKNVRDRIISPQIYFPTLIHPTVLMGKQEFVSIGEGSIIAACNILTVNIVIGKFVILNIACTVGHDCVLEDYTSVMPGVNISGNVRIGEGAYLGTGTKIINNLQVGARTTIGAGAVVNRDLPADCTAVGVPAKAIKHF